jgi:hypothetical protein
MSANNLSDILADVRLSPDELGKAMSYQSNVIQERMMEMCLGFMRELSIQHDNGGFVNGNMKTAILGNQLYSLLTYNDLV